MSASLVGSEMCIRDRVGDVPRSGLVGHNGLGVANDRWKLRVVVDRLRGSCLLYTSDAADDM
eukprot:3135041-Alexandrium_andersonii.AAC.1